MEREATNFRICFTELRFVSTLAMGLPVIQYNTGLPVLYTLRIFAIR